MNASAVDNSALLNEHLLDLMAAFALISTQVRRIHPICGHKRTSLRINEEALISHQGFFICNVSCLDWDAITECTAHWHLE